MGSECFGGTGCMCISHCGLLSLWVSLYYVCMYCIGDASAASTLEQVVDEQYMDMEYPDIVMDLRSFNAGTKSKYDVFWEECHTFLQEEVGMAAEERRHSEVTHLARAISVRDLIQQVSARCPPATPIPCRSWLSLQFWPKSKHTHSKVHYTGCFKVKYMVQTWQFRKDHEDAAAIFRYERECIERIAS